ncbi:hypothetical protein HK100_011882 [Physocladia obscura]|uniref:Uncharacterized protein n=1 Tax=Physocladia obscura TaxID=109957 RepID=A0AAD5XGT4_9FUNG|nr:hypothetical protein HK100_011882 [Physocladia obscura]
MWMDKIFARAAKILTRKRNLKRSNTSIRPKTQRRFLVALSDFSKDFPELPVTSGLKVFDEADDSVQPVVVGHIHALSAAQLEGRDDLLVSVKLYLRQEPSTIQTTDSVIKSIREALKSFAVLFNASTINNLVIQLPFLSGSKSQTFVDLTLWNTIVNVAKKEYGVTDLSVSSVSISLLEYFLESLSKEQLRDLSSVIVDSPNEFNIREVGNAFDKLEGFSKTNNLEFVVSNDVQDGITTTKLGSIIEQLNKKDLTVIDGAVFQDWIARYTCFDKMRSVLLQQG